jgi:hypothetical protein
MNPAKFSQMMKYLTRAKKEKPDLPDVFPASKAPIPAKTQNVQETEAINQFMLRNPRKDMAGGGMLVQPSADGSRPGYANPRGNPEFGKTIFGNPKSKGTIQKKNLEKVKKLEEVVTKSNSQYKKTITSKGALEAVGFKGGYQAIQSKGALRDAVKEKLSKLLTTQQKIDNYVNNVMLAEDALVKDFKNPISHIAKKFGVSRVTVGNWARDSQVYKDNKNIFTGLARELNYNKYKFVGDGVPRLMSDYSIIMQNKLPTSLTMYGGDKPSNFIMQSAYRNFIQNKTAGKKASVTFVGNPELLPQTEWQFIKNGKLYSLDPSVDEIEFNGKTYKNNYLARGDAKDIYKKDFGEVYKVFDDLDKYMNTTTVVGNKDVKLDTVLRQKLFEATGKKNYLLRRAVEIDHFDINKDPFSNLRLLDRRTNVQAGILKRLPKYKNNQKLLNKVLTDIGYTTPYKDVDTFVKRSIKNIDTPIKTIGENKIIQNIQSYSKLPECKIGKAEGGRIGFANSITCIEDGLKEQKIAAQNGNKKAAKELVQVGKVATRAGLLKNLLGPGAILGEAVIEGAIIGNKVLGGTPSDIAYAESYLSYLDPRKYRGELDPLKMRREDMLESTADKNILRSGFAAQDQISDFNKAIEERDLGKARGRMEQYLPAAADAREQGRLVDQSADIISSEAFKDASTVAQEYLQGQSGQQQAGFGVFSVPQSAQADEGRRVRAMSEMRDILEQQAQQRGQVNPFSSDKEILELLKKYNLDPKDYDYTYTPRNFPADTSSKPLTGFDDIRNFYQREQATQNIADAGGVANLAGGGIAKLAGVSSGPPPTSGPNSQGLLSLKNRVRNY